MTNQEKLLAASLAIVLLFCGSIYALNLHDKQVMQQFKNSRYIASWELKTRIEEAKAEQAKYRTIELGFACELIGADGNVYGKEGC